MKNQNKGLLEMSAVVDKKFGDNWTVEDWIQWAYKLGFHLDRWMPWSGVDNRHRIEVAIFEFVKMKSRQIE